MPVLCNKNCQADHCIPAYNKAKRIRRISYKFAINVHDERINLRQLASRPFVVCKNCTNPRSSMVQSRDR